MTTAAEVIKSYQELLTRLEGKGYKPRVKDRKEINSLYQSYSKVISDDETLLEDLTKLQELLTKVNGFIQ